MVNFVRIFSHLTLRVVIKMARTEVFTPALAINGKATY
jgi:hypothetical protein